MKIVFKKFGKLIVIIFSLTLVSCEAMRQISSAMNESTGNCNQKRVDVWSYNEGEWQEGFITSTLLSEEEYQKVENWAQKRLDWYLLNRGVGVYSESDPYTERTYEFRVYCY